MLPLFLKDKLSNIFKWGAVALIAGGLVYGLFAFGRDILSTYEDVGRLQQAVTDRDADIVDRDADIASRDAKIARLAADARHQADITMAKDNALAALNASHSALMANLEELKDEDPETRAWTDEPLPAAIIDLLRGDEAPDPSPAAGDS